MPGNQLVSAGHPRMTKREIIIAIRNRAEKDSSITHCARALVYCLCSMIYKNPQARIEEPFPLPWSKVARLVFLTHRDTCYERMKELVQQDYLKCDGVRGCPPVGYFFLVSNCTVNRAIKNTVNRAIKQGGNRAINNTADHALHISNSFQEERLKERGEELAGIARKKRSGEVLARSARKQQGVELAPPPAAEKGKFLTAEERSAECARLRAEINA